MRIETELAGRIELGTAFSINSDGYYITNAHVVALVESGGSANAVVAVLPELVTHPANVVWRDSEKDLAILHIPAWKQKPLALLSSKKVEINTSLRVMGYSGSSDQMLPGTSRHSSYVVPALKSGIVSEVLHQPIGTDGGAINIFEHSASSNQGNSGSPVMDECGRVLGVNFLKARSTIDMVQAIRSAQGFGSGTTDVEVQQGVFLAVAASEVVKALEANSLNYKSARGGCLGEQLSPSLVLGIIAGVFMLFVAALIALFIYMKRKIPNEKPSLKQLSQIISGRKTVPPAVGVVKPAVPRVSGRIAENIISKKQAGSEASTVINTSSPDTSPVSNNAPVITDAKVYVDDSGKIVQSGMIRLECVAGSGQAIELQPGDAIVVGRDPNVSDITATGDFVSRRHARFSYSRDLVLSVIDLNSTGGTYVEGVKVSTEFPGVIVHMGQKVLLGSEAVVYMQVHT